MGTIPHPPLLLHADPSRYLLNHPNNNVPPHIAALDVKGLHLKPNHPIGIIRSKIQEYFATLPHNNYAVYDAEDPIVTTTQCFDDLRIPPDHPRRSPSDTYYITELTLLRTHTSAHQSEHLRSGKSDALTSTHHRLLPDNNSAATAADTVFQQLASAIQKNRRGKNDDPLLSQDEQMERMIQMMMTMMSSQLATADASSSSTGPANDNKSANGMKAAAAATKDRVVQNVPFQRRFFREERARSKTMFHDTSSFSTSRLHPQRTKTPHQILISEQHQQWYREERALLRELIVLTMRHTDGNLLRFVPSIDEQVELLWNTHGHPVGERYAPNIFVAEGVRLHPNISVIPEWNNNYDDDADDSTQNGNRRACGVRDNIAFRAQLPMPLLGSGARDAISLCAECGWLYGRVASYVESILEEDEDGVQCSTARALAARLDDELAEYHNHLSSLESELPPLELTTTFLQNAPNVRYLTLRSLASRLLPVKEHLCTLAILADGVGVYNLRGGKLLSSLLRLSLDGHHPTSRRTKLVRSIAADCSVPWYKMLHQWMTQGVLEDIHCEFFIKDIRPKQIVIAGVSNNNDIMTFASGYYMWHQRFVLVG